MRVHQSVRAALLAAAAAGALLGPATALAQTAPDTESRIRQLESALAAMQAELSEMRAREAARAPERIAPPAAAPAPAAPAAAPEGMRVGATTFRLGGFIKAEALLSDYADGDLGASGAGRDFYVPGATPVGGRSEDPELDMHAKQTRLTLTGTRTVDGKTLTGYVEADFQSSPGTGTELVTNAYTLAVRRVTLSYGRWLFGQDWTTFQNVAALPETTDFIGATDGAVFNRQALIRYTAPLGPNTQLVLAAENPETTAASRAAPTIVGFDDDQLPDVVARLNHTAGKHSFSIAAIARRLSLEDAGVSRDGAGFGVSVSGKVMVTDKDDLRFTLTAGEGISRYIGLGFRPDAALKGTSELEALGVVAGFAAYRHVWGPKTRSSLIYAFQTYDQDAALTAPTASDASQSLAVNIFHSPMPGLDLGFEFRHAVRELFNGADGSLNRFHFVARQNF
jgi:hypothetical protein